MTEVGTQAVPQRSSAAPLLVNGLKQGATKFLCLVDQKCQHHQHRKDHRQILLAMPKVVLEVIVLILQRIERFIVLAMGLKPSPSGETCRRILSGREPSLLGRTSKESEEKQGSKFYHREHRNLFTLGGDFWFIRLKRTFSNSAA